MRVANTARQQRSTSATPPVRSPTSNISMRGARAASSRDWRFAEASQENSPRECMRMTQAAAVAETPKETPKDASASVIAQHAATLKALPFSDTRDFDEAARGFLGTIENAKVSSPQGRTVWSLEPYAFLNEETAPPTVDPRLWRQSRL